VGHWGILKRSWWIVRSQPGLWGFGAISAAQGALATIVFVAIGGLSGLVGVLGQEMARSELGGAPRSGGLLELLVSGYDVISAWLPLMIGASLVLMLGWLILAVFDVAAVGGAISQTDAVIQGRRASFGDGMRLGFDRWGRTAALLAVSAAPALLGALAQALATFITVTLPLMTDSSPNLSAVLLATQSASGIASLASILSIPLGVLVVLSLRWALLEDATWRPALGGAWHACRSRFADVAVMYLVLLVAAIAAGLALAFVLGVVVAIAGMAAGVAYFAQAVAVAIAIAVIGLLLAGLVGAGFQGVLSLVFSVAYTVFWRELTISMQSTTAPHAVVATEGEFR